MDKILEHKFVSNFHKFYKTLSGFKINFPSKNICQNVHLRLDSLAMDEVIR